MMMRYVYRRNSTINAPIESIILKDYEIQEKDILKIGRVKFAVKEIGYSTDS